MNKNTFPLKSTELMKLPSSMTIKFMMMWQTFFRTDPLKLVHKSFPQKTLNWNLYYALALIWQDINNNKKTPTTTIDDGDDRTNDNEAKIYFS